MEYLCAELQQEVKCLKTFRYHFIQSGRIPQDQQLYTREQCLILANGVCRRVSHHLASHGFRFRCNLCRYCQYLNGPDQQHTRKSLRLFYTVERIKPNPVFEVIHDPLVFLSRRYPGVYTTDNHLLLHSTFQYRLEHNIHQPNEYADHVTGQICQKVREAIKDSDHLFQCGVCPRCRFSDERDNGCALLLKFKSSYSEDPEPPASPSTPELPPPSSSSELPTPCASSEPSLDSCSSPTCSTLSSGGLSPEDSPVTLRPARSLSL